MGRGFRRPAGGPLPLVGGPLAWWQKEVQEELRTVEWKKLAARRGTFQGVEKGVDRALSIRRTRKKGKCKWSPEDIGILSSVQTGANRLGYKLEAAGLADTKSCRLCGAAREDEMHMMWNCPKTQQVRSKYWRKDPPGLHLWPRTDALQRR